MHGVAPPHRSAWETAGVPVTSPQLPQPLGISPDRRRPRRFSWIPPYALLLLLFFWPATIFLRGATTLNIVICRDCQSRWRRSTSVTALSLCALIAAVVCAPLAAMFLDSVDGPVTAI